jgi:tRNA-modifying protein YgfZ
MSVLAADPNPTAALAALSGSTRLHDWGLIRAQGADATAFLQGQLTQDLAGLAPGRARLAGYCSAKGRLMASFIVWSPAPETWWLACSADLLPATLKRLRMFVLRARCQLEDASAAAALWGLSGAALPAELAAAAAWTVAPGPAGATGIRLPDAPADPALADGVRVPRALLVRPTPDAAMDDARPSEQALPPDRWLALEAASGVPRIVAATAEHFVPQMINFELVGGVDFQKGCYPGQEVVARSQYRGTLKRRAQVLTGPAPAQPGQEIFHSDDPGQPAGEVVLAGALAGAMVGAMSGAPDTAQGDRQVILAELKLAALGSGRLHLGAADGPVLALGHLPYPLPGEAG